jgi:hypothetical protein
MNTSKVSKPPSEQLLYELARKSILHERKVEARKEKGA